MRNGALILAAAAAAAVLLPVPARTAPAAAQDAAAQAERVARGRAVAEGRRCADCHATGYEGRGHAREAAPPLAAVARLPSTTERSLRAFLRTPHARTPDGRMSEAELDGLVAYILDLGDR